MNIPITLTEDKNITFKAKGIMLTLLSNPTIKKRIVEFLYKNNPDGYTTIRSGIKELLDNKYLIVEKIKKEKVYSINQSKLL